MGARRLFSAVAGQPVRMNRFWKNVELAATPQGYAILLDSRPLKTPLGTPVAIPHSHHVLALLTAAEWEGQDKVLKSYTLPMTSIVVRALDSFADPLIRSGVVSNVMNYVDTDSICYFQDYPSSFVKLQDDHWKPIHQWLERTYSIKIATTESIVRIKQSQQAHDTFRALADGFDNIKLAAFEKAVLRSKSFMIALALVEGAISVSQAEAAARLEVMQQINRWGEVEDAHDIDQADMRKQLGAARCALI